VEIRLLTDYNEFGEDQHKYTDQASQNRSRRHSLFSAGGKKYIMWTAVQNQKNSLNSLRKLILHILYDRFHL